MTDHDTALGDPTPDAPTHDAHEAPAGGVFGTPGHDHDAHQLPDAVRSWTIDEVLAAARLPERRAQVCLRADLDAEHASLVNELTAYFNAQGEVVEDDDAPLGAETNAAKAQRLADRLAVVEEQQRAAMWRPLFRGMAPEDLAVFNKQHLPKDEKADLTDYHVLLVAECSVDDDITVEKVRELRQKLGQYAYNQLVQTALWVNTRGGVDSGKSPSFLRNPQGQ